MSNDILEITNNFGLKYIVKLHKKNRLGQSVTGDPIVGFHKDGQDLDRIPLFAYYSSDLVQGGNAGLALDASNPSEFLNSEQFIRVKQFIVSNVKQPTVRKPIAVYKPTDSLSINIYGNFNGSPDLLIAGVNDNKPRKHTVYKDAGGSFIRVNRQKCYLNWFTNL